MLIVSRDLKRWEPGLPSPIEASFANHTIYSVMLPFIDANGLGSLCSLSRSAFVKIREQRGKGLRLMQRWCANPELLDPQQVLSHLFTLLDTGGAALGNLVQRCLRRILQVSLPGNQRMIISHFLPIIPHTAHVLMKSTLRDSKQGMMWIVTQKGSDLAFASEELQEDKNLVLTAVAQDGFALEFACEDLQNDREVVLCALGQNGLALAFASEELKQDYNIVKVAVAYHGEALEFAYDDLADNPDIVSIAVRQNGSALQFASEALQDDSDLVLEAVTQNAGALQFASSGLKASKHFLRTLLCEPRIKRDSLPEGTIDEKLLLSLELENVYQTVDDQTEKTILEHILVCYDEDWKCLNLICCNLTEMPEKWAPLYEHITDLRIRENQFTTFPDISKMHALRSIELDGNPIEEIPPHEHLEITFNFTGCYDCSMLGQLLNRCTIGNYSLHQIPGLTSWSFRTHLEKFLEHNEDLTKKLPNLLKLRNLEVDSIEDVQDFLTKNHMLLLHAGWVNHSVFIEIMFDSLLNTYRMRIFNTGEYADSYHEEVDLRGKKKTAYVEWTGITQENWKKVNPIRLLQEIDKMKAEEASHLLYNILRDSLEVIESKELTDHQITSSITPQVLNNCVVRCFYAWLKSVTPKWQYHDFLHRLRQGEVTKFDAQLAKGVAPNHGELPREVFQEIKELLRNKYAKNQQKDASLL